jgi:23S rRNA (cytosine1962-C5)-methyltransferase
MYKKKGGVRGKNQAARRTGGTGRAPRAAGNSRPRNNPGTGNAVKAGQNKKVGQNATALKLPITTELATNWDDYVMIDAGEGEKLERWGKYILRRPDPQAGWRRLLQMREFWVAADAKVVVSEQERYWKFMRKSLSENSTWKISYQGKYTFNIKLSDYKHTGVFPEQSVNWDWIERQVKEALIEGRTAEVLNLFGYSGGASMAVLAAGGQVTHVDSAGQAIGLAQKNILDSDLSKANARFIKEDSLEFVERQARKGKKYDAIIMDPPAYGRGGGAKSWKIARDLPTLLDACSKILTDKPAFMLINVYAGGLTTAEVVELTQTKIKRPHYLQIVKLGIPVGAGSNYLPGGISLRLVFKQFS